LSGKLDVFMAYAGGVIAISFIVLDLAILYRNRTRA
jgi:hypothetical protein